MQCFENFGGGQMPQMPPLVARLVPVVPSGYAPGGNRTLIAGCRPAQAFVIERSLCAHLFGNTN